MVHVRESRIRNQIFFFFISVVLRDICPILKDPKSLTAVIDLFEDYVRQNHQHVDLIVGKYITIVSVCYGRLI